MLLESSPNFMFYFEEEELLGVFFVRGVELGLDLQSISVSSISNTPSSTALIQEFTVSGFMNSVFFFFLFLVAECQIATSWNCSFLQEISQRRLKKSMSKTTCFEYFVNGKFGDTD